MNRFAIAVDLGGTNLRGAVVREDGQVQWKEKAPSESRRKAQGVLRQVADLVQRLSDRISGEGGAIAGVGLGFPGIVDPTKGIVHQSPHFPDWIDLDVRSHFRDLTWPLALDNDANMAACGEQWKGAGQGLKNFIVLTFGTGIGGGIVMNGEVLHGERGFAGEVGHIVIEGEGPRCECGGRGCLELYASALGILRLVETSEDRLGREKLVGRLGKPLDRLTVADLYEAARDGDIFAHATFQRMGHTLGIGLASLINTLGVETVILGGGVSEAWDFFIEPARKEMSERLYRESAKRVKIVRAQLGDDAGLVGCAAAVFKGI